MTASLPFTSLAPFCPRIYIHRGTLVFSHRGYNLDTAFHIMHSAIYLALYDEIQACIVQEIMHGLFHAFLEFTEYERITGGSGVLAGVDVGSMRVEHRGRSSLPSARMRKTRICLVKDGGILSNSLPS